MKKNTSFLAQVQLFGWLSIVPSFGYSVKCIYDKYNVVFRIHIAILWKFQTLYKRGRSEITDVAGKSTPIF